jgi:hypothetical protein
MGVKLNLAFKRLKLIRKINLIFLNLTLLLFLLSAIYIIPQASTRYAVGRLRDNIEKSMTSEEAKEGSRLWLDSINNSQETTRVIALLYLISVLGIVLLCSLNVYLLRKVRRLFPQEADGEEEKQIPFGAAH